MTYERETGGYALRFRDIPEAFAYGETDREALRRAPHALESALYFYFEARRLVPIASEPNDKEELVTLPLESAAKALLHNEMILQNVNVLQLSRLMKAASRKRVPKLNMTQPINIDVIARAISALGKHLQLSGVKA